MDKDIDISIFEGSIAYRYDPEATMLGVYVGPGSSVDYETIQKFAEENSFNMMWGSDEAYGYKGMYNGDTFLLYKDMTKLPTDEYKYDAVMHAKDPVTGKAIYDNETRSRVQKECEHGVTEVDWSSIKTVKEKQTLESDKVQKLNETILENGGSVFINGISNKSWKKLEGKNGEFYSVGVSVPKDVSESGFVDIFCNENNVVHQKNSINLVFKNKSEKTVSLVRDGKRVQEKMKMSELAERHEKEMDIYRKSIKQAKNKGDTVKNNEFEAQKGIGE